MLNNAVLQWFNELSAQGVLITDTDLVIRAWNHWLEHHTGRLAAEMIGRNLLDAYPELSARGLELYYRDALAGQGMVLAHRFHSYLLPIPRSVEGDSFDHMQQSARIAPLIEDGRVVGTLTLIDDVTERVARELELEELLVREQAARAEAESANRAKDEFLAVVSHELRTPLNAILGWIQILRRGEISEAVSEQALEAMERNARAQAKIIEDILDVSGVIAGKVRLDVRPVDLVTVVSAAVHALMPAADAKGIRLGTSLDPETGPVSGDVHRLQQVVWNLVSNAIKFTPGGGRVDVRLERDGPEVVITVVDTGQGIIAEFLPFVFDRFRQADSTSTRKHGGLGLGLSIVHHLVEMHGGTVRAESSGAGLGATFEVRLPLMTAAGHTEIRITGTQTPGETEEPATYSEANRFASLKGLRVLVVDDEPDARGMLKMMLRQCEADVRVSATAREALEVITQWRPDVLVSDIGMPGEDGYSLINQVRALKPEEGGDTPAVALTGYAGAGDRTQSLTSGYQMHLSKPVEIAVLTSAIADLSKRSAKSFSKQSTERS